MTSNINIEQEGVSVLQSTLRKTGLIHPYILSNDKTPIWDGEVILYENDSDKKEDIRGRIPVQVKSHKRTPEKKHELEVSDLEKMLTDGGAIFFAVYLDEDLAVNKICYHKFLPVDLENLLKKKLKKGGKVKRTLTFDLLEFPDSNERIIEIFEDFLMNRQTQMSFIEVKKPTLDEINSGRYKHYEINFKAPIKNYNDIFEFQKYNGITPYLKDTESGVAIPIRDNIEIASLFIEDKLNIGVSGKVYYTKVIRKFEKNGRTGINFGSTLNIKNIDGKMKFNYSRPDLLRDAIKANEFILEIARTHSFEIDGKTVMLDEEEIKDFNFRYFENQLNYFNDVKITLEKLGVENDLDLSKVTDKDDRLLKNLISSLLKDETIKSNGEVEVFKAKVGNLTLGLYFWPSSKRVGQLKNLFNKSPWLRVRESSGEEYDTSIFELLSVEDWRTFDNISINSVIETFEKLKENKSKRLNSCQVFVKVFNAYKQVDQSDEKRRAKLFKLAKKLADWDFCNATINETVVKVNHYLIKKEEGNLDEQDYIELNSLLEKYKDDPKTAFAVNVLMGAKFPAKLSLKKIPQEEIVEIKEFPIYKLFESLWEEANNCQV
ncbi:hypothetical protein [Streptococcus sobrinus]|uniref:hypothetical protein n=1 Tax=Streptococcus sobrinus TaxID=1310 RepID=UPI0002F55C50|nr:hypothetical protein [Streptococcus sobrinus]